VFSKIGYDKQDTEIEEYNPKKTPRGKQLTSPVFFFNMVCYKKQRKNEHEPDSKEIIYLRFCEDTDKGPVK
jgi:hypothetical protein